MSVSDGAGEQPCATAAPPAAEITFRKSRRFIGVRSVVTGQAVDRRTPLSMTLEAPSPGQVVGRRGAVQLLDGAVALRARDLRANVRLVREVDEARHDGNLDPWNGCATIPVACELGDVGMRRRDEAMAAHAALERRYAGERRAACRAMAILAVEVVGDVVRAVAEVDRLLRTFGAHGRPTDCDNADERGCRANPPDHAAPSTHNSAICKRDAAVLFRGESAWWRTSWLATGAGPP